MKFKYNSVWEKYIIKVFLVTLFTLPLIFFLSVKFKLPFYFCIIWLMIHLLTVLYLAYKDSNYYNKFELDRHLGNFANSEKIQGKIINKTYGRQMIFFTVEGFFNNQKITISDRFRTFDSISKLTVGDSVEMIFNLENSNEFCIKINKADEGHK